jgi:nitrate reductase delta subunit
MRRSKRAPEHSSAVTRVADWTRHRFALPEDCTLSVAEVACGLPGCPPIETVVTFWTAPDRRHSFKVFKPLVAVIEDDLPPAWMKDAIIRDDSPECC